MSAHRTVYCYQSARIRIDCTIFINEICATALHHTYSNSITLRIIVNRIFMILLVMSEGIKVVSICTCAS